MTNGRFLLAILVVLTAFVPGCNKGLGPITEPTGFSGVIHFKNWPPPEKVFELRLVAFEEYPADSAGILETLTKDPSNVRVAIYPHVTTGIAGALKILGNKSADTVDYTFLKEGTLLKEATYNYVVMAWRFGPNYFADWTPAGVYTLNPGTFEPAAVIVRSNRLRKDVNITVDFNNLPPKPWR